MLDLGTPAVVLCRPVLQCLLSASLWYQSCIVLCLRTGERVPIHCLDHHPTQPHVVATGGQDGTLCIWDMRQEKFPVTLLSAHSTDSKYNHIQ